MSILRALPFCVCGSNPTEGGAGENPSDLESSIPAADRLFLTPSTPTHTHCPNTCPCFCFIFLP